MGNSSNLEDHEGTERLYVCQIPGISHHDEAIASLERYLSSYPSRAGGRTVGNAFGAS